MQNISFFKDLSILDYSNWLSIGFLLGIGAITGDSVKSFFKRRFNIKPGKPWIPFDQTDFIIGALLFISIIYIPELKIIIAALVVSFILHITVSHIAYYLKLRKVKL